MQKMLFQILFTVKDGSTGFDLKNNFGNVAPIKIITVEIEANATLSIQNITGTLGYFLSSMQELVKKVDRMVGQLNEENMGNQVNEY